MSAAGWPNRPRGWGVEIFPGMSCSEIVYGENGEVEGRGRGRVRPHPRRHARRRATSRGWSCTANTCCWAKACAASPHPRRCWRNTTFRPGKTRQKFGLGMKEIWEIDPEKHKPGKVVHTMGWPLGKNAGGGSFIYHLDNNQVYVGFVVHPELREPAPVPLHGVPALQASPDGGRASEGRKAHRATARRADQRGRLAVDAQGRGAGRGDPWLWRGGW